MSEDSADLRQRVILVGVGYGLPLSLSEPLLVPEPHLVYLEEQGCDMLRQNDSSETPPKMYPK